MDILRFITAGSVDDGKSTLIGRLLYDSKSILVDQLEALEKQSKNKNEDGIDLAILTDGLRAEREQGITIDVAYRYFATNKRKFIIADAPGHVQYTRNLVTGASNSQVMVILIDARNGVTEQTRRHSIIASLLKLQHIIVAVNKMDLMDYSQETYLKIKEDYMKVADSLGLKEVSYFPISAMSGANIVEVSDKMPWYQGDSLLTHLESIELKTETELNESRFQVQFVIRPQTTELHDYRGYAGQIISGSYKVGDSIKVLPQDISTTIAKIEVNGKEVEEVFTQQSCVIHLSEDIDVSRGDYLIKTDEIPQVQNEFSALLCWMDYKELTVGGKYFLQHHNRVVNAVIRQINKKIDVNTLERMDVTDPIKLNEVVSVEIKTASPLVFDSFDKNQKTGSAILIDQTSNSTVAAVMIQG